MDGAPPHPVVSALLAEAGRAVRQAQGAAPGDVWLAPAEIRFRWVGEPPAGAPSATVAVLGLGDAAPGEGSAGDGG